MRGKEIVLTGMSLPKVKGLTTEQCEAMVRLSRLPAFSDLVDKVQADEVSLVSAICPLRQCNHNTYKQTRVYKHA